MKTSIKVIAALALTLYAVPAWALKVVKDDQVYDVKGLVKIERLKDKTRLYHYALNDSKDELVLDAPLEIPDKRPLKEKNPKGYWGRVAWRWTCRLAQASNIYGAFKGGFFSGS